MRKYLVLFDLDETLITCKSLFETYFHYCIAISTSYQEGLARYNHVIDTLHQMQGRVDRNEINKWFYRNFQGISKQKMSQIANDWFHKSKNKPGFYNKVAVNELIDHRNNGAEIIIVSGSFYECVSYISNELEVSHTLCIHLEETSGIYTGNIAGIQTIGEGKLLAVKNYLQKLNITTYGSYAYGDHESDLSILEFAENPVVVGNNAVLKQIAAKRGWRVLN